MQSKKRNTLFPKLIFPAVTCCKTLIELPLILNQKLNQAVPLVVQMYIVDETAWNYKHYCDPMKFKGLLLKER